MCGSKVISGNNMEKYKIIRNFFKGDKRTVKTGLTLEEAQEHCRDPETSSRTCKQRVNVQRTEERGHWFDGYEEQ